MLPFFLPSRLLCLGARGISYIPYEAKKRLFGLQKVGHAMKDCILHC